MKRLHQLWCKEKHSHSFFKSFSYLLLLFLCINSTAVYAEFSSNDFLWLEFDETSLNINGAISQPIVINYGIFPNKIKNISDLDEIEAFYTFGQKDKVGKDIFYKPNINIKKNKPILFINSVKTNWCMVLVKGIKRYDNFEYNYLAKVSFFIFGHSNIPKYDNPITIEHKPNFDIKIFRERLKDKFNYDRERWFPIRAKLKFGDHPLVHTEVNIINQSGNSERVISDNNGEIVYIPRYIESNFMDKKNYFDYDLITVKYSLNNKVYHYAYTVLFKHLKREPKRFNIKIGLAIFIFSAIITFFLLSKIKENITA